MLNAREMNNPPKVSNVFVLRQVPKTTVQCVVVMAGLIPTARCCKENPA